MKQFTVFFLLTGVVLFTLGGTQASPEKTGRESTFRLLAQNMEGNTTNTGTSAQQQPAETPAETPEKNRPQPQQKEVAAPQRTPAVTLEPISHLVHLVLVMTVNPGYGGQQFIPETLPKIRQIRQILDRVNPQALIQVDGGISESTVPLVIEAGAQIFVAGNAIFNHPDGISRGIQAIKACFPH